MKGTIVYVLNLDSSCYGRYGVLINWGRDMSRIRFIIPGYLSHEEMTLMNYKFKGINETNI